jgi:hypothetical protein
MQSDYSDSEDLELVDAAEKQLPSPTPSDSINIADLPDSVAHSLLFELPREIRDRIYSFCLTSRDNLPIEWPSLWRPYGLQPQLLRTCKIIHDEAGPLLYSLNAQMFHHPSDANVFVRAFTSPALGKNITRLKLHIRAQDMRLWMPYVTSTVASRSVKADFPALKDLEVRYRSNRWQHHHSVESNLKVWSDDSRLDEIINGLRHVFLGIKTNTESQRFWEFSARLPLPGVLGQEELPLGHEDFPDERQLHDAVPRNTGPYVRRHDEPLLRVTCACRVHAAHFAELTNPPPPTDETQSTSEDPQASTAPPTPVREGEVFRGFTAVDLRHDVKRLYDQEAGSANVAQTPYADKRGVLLSLEIHCLDPKRDPAQQVP